MVQTTQGVECCPDSAQIGTASNTWRCLSAEVTRVDGWRPYHVWIYRDGLKYAGRFCKSRSEAERYMDVAGVPRDGRHRKWRTVRTSGTSYSRR